jgi:hypothetical protein
MHKSPDVESSYANQFQEMQKKKLRFFFDDLSHDLRDVKLVFIGNKISYSFDDYRKKAIYNFTSLRTLLVVSYRCRRDCRYASKALAEHRMVA